MRLFIDTGSVAEVEEIAARGILPALTNPRCWRRRRGIRRDHPADLRPAGARFRSRSLLGS
jgi:hypothetical protein